MARTTGQHDIVNKMTALLMMNGALISYPDLPRSGVREISHFQISKPAVADLGTRLVTHLRSRGVYRKEVIIVVGALILL